MKKILLIIAAAFLICFSAVGAQALTQPFFAYDNFTLQFGSPGQPGSAGGIFTSDGKVLSYSNPLDVIGWFVISGTTTGAQAINSNSQYLTKYTGNLSIYQTPAHSSLLWSGTGYVETIVNANGATFPAIYPRPPSFVGQPANYNSIGDGYYVGSGSGDWASIPSLTMNWLGTYDWAYDVSLHGQVTPNTRFQYGNAQGGMSVPEPTSLLLLGLGLVGLAGIRRKFKS